MSYILTVDPALTTWAYAVFDSSGFCIESRTIGYKSKMSQESRLWDIFSTLDNLPYNINHMVIEKQFVEIMTQIVGMIRRRCRKKNHTNNPIGPIFLAKTSNR